MTLATLVMVIMICVGCILGITGVAVLAHRGLALQKAAKQAGITSSEQVQEIVLRVQAIEPQLRELQGRQTVLAESLQNLSVTLNRLNQIKKKVDWLLGPLRGLRR